MRGVINKLIYAYPLSWRTTSEHSKGFDVTSYK